jgi:hypothetical protein
MEVVVFDGELRLAGVVGGVVSAGGGVVLSTVTVMLLLVVVLPAASLAMAVRVWAPSAKVVVSQVMEYGLEVSSAPSLLVFGSLA